MEDEKGKWMVWRATHGPIHRCGAHSHGMENGHENNRDDSTRMATFSFAFRRLSLFRAAQTRALVFHTFAVARLEKY